ncbi:MAG: dTDP-4-dehydrorhamnose reductase [Aquisalinus sp.]|nr:dTDP-4-dehydrorhamnose reductase [Aquisalinus sp.]
MLANVWVKLAPDVSASATKILITGAGGQIGSRVKVMAQRVGYSVTALGYDQLDITDAGAVTKTLSRLSPDVIVNCAAYTDVDKAEQEPDVADALNAIGPANIAKASPDNCLLIHLSTDYVFNGNAIHAYLEEDLPHPETVYGKSKLDGEKQVLALHPFSIILRTAWVYSTTHRNFLKTMMDIGRKRKDMRVVDDQIGSPTLADDIADAIVQITHLATTSKFDTSKVGIYHYTGAGNTSWYGFAKTIFAQLELETGLKIDISPIPTQAYPTPAKRPLFSVLSTEKISGTFDIKPVPWEQRVRETVSKVISMEQNQ